MNVTREDIIGLADLDEDAVEAVAEHEHLPEVIAAALANYLVHEDHGCEKIRLMIKDDIHDAIRRGDRAEAALLVRVMHRFCTEHMPS